MTKILRSSPSNRLRQSLQGFTRTSAIAAVGGTTIGAVTAGVNVKPIDHVLVRPALRYGKALDGRNAFADSNQSHQFTGGLDVIITF